ncbi:MAG: N-succinylarginine dihydrolase [Parachlamydia sp.]|nr:N-succinylarginine dihydrolase [Parachlamydia sp.]
MSPDAFELNLDSLVGPTHNYSGLSYGNVASMGNANAPSNPREAALQGLQKMKFLHDKGIKQAVLPPHERPHIPFLKSLGFEGRDSDIIAKATDFDLDLYNSCCSASAMWAANAATVCPSTDSLDHHVHFTTANLSSTFHRGLEADFTSLILKTIFRETVFFSHHAPLPAGTYIGDEGAANHTRFCSKYGNPGIQLFVFGRYGIRQNAILPELYPARQTYEASTSVARLHRLYPNRAIFAQQNSEAIDSGVFHNDVIAVGNGNVFLYHEKAFLATESVIDEIRKKAQDFCDMEMVFVPITDKQLTIEEAVNCYLFNSQLLTLPDGSMALAAPVECSDGGKIENLISQIISQPENPIKEVHYFNLRESMRNGGGPACLRLRVVLNDRELSAMHQGVLMSDRLYSRLTEWITKYYRDRLVPSDLADPKLVTEIHQGLDELTRILNLGHIYSFQR